MARLQPEAQDPSATTEAWSPEAHRQAAPPPPPKLDQSPPFVWMWHRERWTVIEGHVVPLLRKFPMIAGVNGVHEQRDTSGRTHLVTDAAVAQAAVEGWKVIPVDLAPDGKSYVRRVSGLPMCFVSCFESVYSGSSQITPDLKAYAQWLRSLVEKGHIDECPDYVLDRLRGEIEAKRNESLGAQATRPKHKAIAKRHGDDLAAVELAQANSVLTPAKTEVA